MNTSLESQSLDAIRLGVKRLRGDPSVPPAGSIVGAVMCKCARPQPATKNATKPIKRSVGSSGERSTAAPPRRITAPTASSSAGSA